MFHPRTDQKLLTAEIAKKSRQVRKENLNHSTDFKNLNYKNP
jgi:hypothetical protein